MDLHIMACGTDVVVTLAPGGTEPWVVNFAIYNEKTLNRGLST